jgi:hypothetical protein
MRYVAEPLLYHNYSKPDSTWNFDEHYRFRKFLTVVLGRPELLQHIRSLYIGSWRVENHNQFGFEFDGDDDDDDDDDADDYGEPNVRFPDGLRTLYSEYAERSTLNHVWRHALKTGDEVAEIALLMSLTPNLERIEFCMPDLDLLEEIAPQYFWPSLLVTSSEWDPSRHFSRLNSVVVHRRDSRNLGNARDVFGFDIDSFLSFIGLPSLKFFWVVDDGKGHYLERPEDHPLNDEELHLTDLLLGVSYIDPVKVLQILKRCTKLEAFDCDFQQELPSFIPGFSWNTIREALASSRNTLEVLTLNALLGSQLVEEGTLSIGSLTDFTSLRRLDVPQTTLLGFEVVYEDYTLAIPALPFEEMLPSSLESLTIDRCTLTCIPYLEAMSTKLGDRFPHLREIRLGEIDLREDDLDQYPNTEHDAVIQGRKDRVECLKDRFVAAGVQWS